MKTKILIVLLFSLNSFAMKDVNICLSHEPPFVVIDKEDNFSGLVVDKLNELYGKLPNYKINYIKMPFKRCSFEIAIHDKIQAMGWAQKTPNNSLILDFPNTKMTMKYRVWYMKGSRFDKAKITSKQDLLKYRIGIVRGITENEYLSYAILNGFLKTTKATSIESVLKLLVNNRVDFVYTSNKTINWFKEKNKIKNGVIASKVLARDIDFYISPLSREITDKNLLKKINSVSKK